MRVLPFALAAGLLTLAACNAPEPEDVAAPATPATTPEPVQGTIEPGMGSPAEPGAGVPGSSQETADVANPDGTNADPILPRETPNP